MELDLKRTKLLTILIVGLFLCFMLAGFGSQASNSRPENRAAGSPSPPPPSTIDPNNKGEARTATQPNGDEDEDSDPDLGKFHGKINRNEYLRLRDEFIGLKRGIEPGRPFDPAARGRAIEQMEQRESELSGKNSFFGSIANLLGFDLNAGPTWTALGPAPLFPNGSGNPATSFTGRVTSVVVDPT